MIKEKKMNLQSTKKTKKYRLDIIVISVIIVASLLLFLVISLTKKEGSLAVVEINGEVAGEYALSVDGVFVLNNGTNVLVIENGTAYLNYSSCPDHVCEKTGKISYVGQTIVCLPNRLSITVKGNVQNGVDLVS